MISIEQLSQRLTRREEQVALLIVRGLSNKEVARELGLSNGTVKLHVHRIFQKTGVRNRYSLIQMGLMLVGSNSALLRRSLVDRDSAANTRNRGLNERAPVAQHRIDPTVWRPGESGEPEHPPSLLTRLRERRP
jgi:DNA-binding CsgD family transcriptional regulator